MSELASILLFIGLVPVVIVLAAIAPLAWARWQVIRAERARGERP